MVELPTFLWLYFGFIVGTLAVELNLRRNLKRDPTVVPFVFGKDVILKESHGINMQTTN